MAGHSGLGGRVPRNAQAADEVVSARRLARIMKENKFFPLVRKRGKPITKDSNHKAFPKLAGTEAPQSDTKYGLAGRYHLYRHGRRLALIGCREGHGHA